MAQTYSIELHGLDASITLNSYPMGTRADALLFDEEANVINETYNPPMYIGYCHWEMVYMVACQMFDHRRQVESSQIAEAVSALLPECECD